MIVYYFDFNKNGQEISSPHGVFCVPFLSEIVAVSDMKPVSVDLQVLTYDYMLWSDNF